MPHTQHAASRQPSHNDPVQRPEPTTIAAAHLDAFHGRTDDGPPSEDALARRQVPVDPGPPPARTSHLPPGAQQHHSPVIHRTNNALNTRPLSPLPHYYHCYDCCQRPVAVRFVTVPRPSSAAIRHGRIGSTSAIVAIPAAATLATRPPTTPTPTQPPDQNPRAPPTTTYPVQFPDAQGVNTHVHHGGSTQRRSPTDLSAVAVPAVAAAPRPSTRGCRRRRRSRRA